MTRYASKHALATLVLFAAFCLPDSFAWANSCSAKASQLAASNGGRVLSAIARGNKCHIKILIKPNNGPPKRKSFVVAK